MDKLDITKDLLSKIGMPAKQQGSLCSLALLAMAGLKPDTPWENATNNWIRIHDVIAFIAENYNVTYAENSRETFRKQAMHPFRTAALIEDNGLATNSPNYCYRITPEFLKVLQDISEKEYYAAGGGLTLEQFIAKHESLSKIYTSKKRMQKMPVHIGKRRLRFSPGKHNELQKAIIEEFAPRFAQNSECLYVGDTTKKDLVRNARALSELGFEITLHDKMPDVILYREDKDWVYFVEAVTSVGPMDPKRILEIEAMTKNVKAGKIYVTAFLDFATFKKFSEQLAWETEVWIADMPDHMIHLDGDKFLGPK
jgi:hypothetical protein